MIYIIDNELTIVYRSKALLPYFDKPIMTLPTLAHVELWNENPIYFFLD
jgi:hypothetical protein